MKARISTGLKLFLLSGWAILVLWNYFWSFPLIHLPEILQNGFMLLVLLLFFSALGRRIFRMTSIKFGSFAEELSFSFGIGTGVVSFLVFGLAAVDALYEIVVVGLILLLFAPIYSDAKTICLRAYDVLRSLSSQNWSLTELFFLFLIAFGGIATFFAAATPPFFYDALAYHLAVPHKYLQHHGFHFLPHHYYSNFPANIGMIFLIGLSFSGGMLAKLLSWLYAPMTVLAVYAFAKKHWGRSIALTSAAIISCVPGILILSTLTSVDLGVMFYSSLSFFALSTWFSSNLRSWVLLSGVFCSLAIGSKYTAIPVTFASLAITLVVHKFFTEKRSMVSIFQELVTFSVIVFFGISPWLFKNFMYTGNPIFPFFNTLFGVHTGISVGYAGIMARRLPSSSQWLDWIKFYLTAPWTITMTDVAAAGKAGAIFLLGFPAVFLLKTRDVIARNLLLASICSFWLWVFLVPRVLRYAFQIFPLLSIVIAYTLWNLPVSRHWKKFFVGGVGLLMAYNMTLFFSESMFLKPFSYLFANYPQEDFLLEHGVNHYPALQYMNTRLPSHTKILFVGEFRGFYCERDYILQIVRGDEDMFLQQLIHQATGITELVQELQHRGITHILLNRSEMRRIAQNFLNRDSYFNWQNEKSRELYQQLFSIQHSHLLFSQHQVELYELAYSR